MYGNSYEVGRLGIYAIQSLIYYSQFKNLLLNIRIKFCLFLFQFYRLVPEKKHFYFHHNMI